MFNQVVGLFSSVLQCWIDCDSLARVRWIFMLPRLFLQFLLKGTKRAGFLKNVLIISFLSCEKKQQNHLLKHLKTTRWGLSETSVWKTSVPLLHNHRTHRMESHGKDCLLETAVLFLFHVTIFKHDHNCSPTKTKSSVMFLTLMK